MNKDEVVINNRIRKGYVSLSEDIIQIEYSENLNSKIGVILFPPDPNWGGTMFTGLINDLFWAFDEQKINVMRFNFVKHQIFNNIYDKYITQASICFEEFIKLLPHANMIFFVGYSFGSLISLNIVLRRPEIKGLIMIAPPILNYDFFSWVNVCKVSGLLMYGTRDELTPEDVMTSFHHFLFTKKIELEKIQIFGANHHFNDKHKQIFDNIMGYINTF